MYNIISTSKIMENIHHINDVAFISQNLKESLFEYGQLHLWTPYYYSGRPLYAQPEYYFLDFNFLYLLLFRDILIAINLATITYFFLAGLGMYFLFLTFKDDKKCAFIASIIYMFNGYMHSFVIHGNLNVLAGYSLIPFAFMFFVKALNSKDFAKNAILSGLFIALQLFAGGTLLIPYEVTLFGIYTLFYLFGKNLGNRILKVVYVGVMVILISFSISAIKLLPGLEFMDLSNRGSGVSYQEYLGHPIDFSNIIPILVTNLFSGGASAFIGIMGFILLLFGFYNFKKRYVIFSLVLLVFSLFMAVQGPVADIFFKLPVFNQLRHIERALFLTAFASSILAGAGYLLFSQKIEKLLRINKNIIVLSAVVLLILVELLFLQAFPQSVGIIKPTDIAINDHISKDTGRFRTINLALSTLVGASGYNHLAKIGIGTIKGGSGIWFNDYLGYLSIAQQTKPAKLWGLLNDKYVISDKELDISGLKFVDKFAECGKCTVGEADGPYLYENSEFMPRAFYTDKSVMVIGDKQNAEQIVYALLLNDNFNPKKAVIVYGKNSLSQYDPNELRNYNAIILAIGLDTNDVGLLRNYVDGGGILLPDIFDNKNTINEEDVNGLFKKLNGSFEEIEILEYENNKVVYDANNKKGFLVLSERFSNFPGWQASGKSKKEILKVNGIITAVFVDSDDRITFKYKPKSFRNGLLISSITLVLLIIYFIYSFISSGGKNKG